MPPATLIPHRSVAGVVASTRESDAVDINTTKTACHSERSEEPPYLLFVLVCPRSTPKPDRLYPRPAGKFLATANPTASTIPIQIATGRTRGISPPRSARA
jgi:hypothetical protein